MRIVRLLRFILRSKRRLNVFVSGFGIRVSGARSTPRTVKNVELYEAAKSQLKDLQTYYFHNCVYENLWEDATRRDRISTKKVIEKYGQDHWLIVCGDAAMSPYELMQKGGAIDLWHDNDLAGIDWLAKLEEGFVRSVWLNPEPKRSWDWTHSCQQINTVFNMEPLTLDGIKDSVSYLRKAQVKPTSY